MVNDWALRLWRNVRTRGDPGHLGTRRLPCVRVRARPEHGSQSAVGRGRDLEGDFEYAHERCPGGVYDLTMHPQVVGRGHRMLMLERLIDHFSGHSGVVFESLGDYAKRWKTA